MNQTMRISIDDNPLYTTNYSINEHQLYETNSMKQTILYETESMRLRFFFITCAMPWCSVPPRWWGVPSGLFLALKKVYLTTHGGREAKTQPRHRTAIGLVSSSYPMPRVVLLTLLFIYLNAPWRHDDMSQRRMRWGAPRVCRDNDCRDFDPAVSTPRIVDAT